MDKDIKTKVLKLSLLLSLNILTPSFSNLGYPKAFNLMNSQSKVLHNLKQLVKDFLDFVKVILTEIQMLSAPVCPRLPSGREQAGWLNAECETFAR